MATMKFWNADYTLKPKNKKLALRRGTLIKVEWPDKLIGYADLMPWPELGDEPVSIQMMNLKKGKMSAMMEQTIWLARRDAQARKEKRNLMAGLPRVRNSFLIQDPLSVTDAELGDARRVGFMSVKIKCGNNIPAELVLIEKILKMGSLSLRLDFNAKLTSPDFLDFLQKIPTAFHNRIEYVEDPFPYSLDGWRESSKVANLAMDMEFSKVSWDSLKNPMPFKVLVIKPARIDLGNALEIVNKRGFKMTVTSNLDHPVGVMHAAAVASEMKKIYPNILLDCGCFTHLEYQEDEFSKRLPTTGPMTSEVAGTGIGFDDLLESQKWVQVNP